MTKTKGDMIKEKFTNFVRFCKTYLQIDETCASKLDAMDKLPAELIIATLQEPLHYEAPGSQTETKWYFSPSEALRLP